MKIICTFENCNVKLHITVIIFEPSLWVVRDMNRCGIGVTNDAVHNVKNTFIYF
jgi:hypothetical protein